MCHPYRIPAGQNARFDEIDAAGYMVEVGRGSGGSGGPGADFPPVWYWCDINDSDGRRLASGVGDEKEAAFNDAAANLTSAP